MRYAYSLTRAFRRAWRLESTGAHIWSYFGSFSDLTVGGSCSGGDGSCLAITMKSLPPHGRTDKISTGGANSDDFAAKNVRRLTNKGKRHPLVSRKMGFSRQWQPAGSFFSYDSSKPLEVTRGRGIAPSRIFASTTVASRKSPPRKSGAPMAEALNTGVKRCNSFDEKGFFPNVQEGS